MVDDSSAVSDIDSLIKIITDKEVITKTMNDKQLTKLNAKIYLSALIFYKFPDPSDEYICDRAHSLCEYFTTEKFHDYKECLIKYKNENALNMSKELECTHKHISNINSPEKKWEILFKRQERMVDIARKYFNKIMSSIQKRENEPKEVHSIDHMLSNSC